MNNKRTRLTISIITAVVLLACACPATSLPLLNNQPTPTQIVIPPVIPTQSIIVPEVPTLVPDPPSNVLLSDNFEAPSDEMETFSDESGSAETSGGVYVLRSTGDVWNWGRSESEFPNTIIEVDVKLITGPANNNAGMGVICRMYTREDTSIDGYLLAISADGYYSIRSISAGSMNPLVDWTYSDVINQGAGDNKIRATCNNNDLILEVNGVQLATASVIAGGSPTGSIAFSAVSFESAEPVAEIHFDNLLVTTP